MKASYTNDFFAPVLLSALQSDPNGEYTVGVFSLTESEDLVEPDDASYKRQKIELQKIKDVYVQNKNTLNFPEAEKSWGLITHLGIFYQNQMILLKNIGMELPVDKKERILIKQHQIVIYVGSNSLCPF